MDPHLVHMMTGMFIVMPFVILLFTIIMLVPFWMIWKKAGFSPWLSILMVIPLVSFVMLYVLAFAEWKVVPVNQATVLPPRV
jgi:hypothetical protein